MPTATLKSTPMKLKTEILKDWTGKVNAMEEFSYDGSGRIIRKDFKDYAGNLTLYKTFEYDANGNCIKANDFTNTNELIVSFEYGYNRNNERNKTIERGEDGSICDWREMTDQPENNLRIWIARDEEGNVVHRAEENTTDHSERRYNADGLLYEIQFSLFDPLHRLTEKTTTDEKGNVTEKITYHYESESEKELRQYFIAGQQAKTEERVYNNNHNLISFIKRDKDGVCTDWNKTEFDAYGNKTKYIWGSKEGMELGEKTYELVYGE